MRRLRRLAHLVLFCPFSKGLQVGARPPGLGAGLGTGCGTRGSCALRCVALGRLRGWEGLGRGR